MMKIFPLYEILLYIYIYVFFTYFDKFYSKMLEIREIEIVKRLKFLSS